MKRNMTKVEALSLFNQVDRSPKGDRVWKRESWSNFTDALCKEGSISMRQYETWSNPF